MSAMRFVASTKLPNQARIPQFAEQGYSGDKERVGIGGKWDEIVGYKLSGSQ